METPILPHNPAHNGWHWLTTPQGDYRPWEWHAQLRGWIGAVGVYTAAQMAEFGWVYKGECLPPAGV
jgi:hypothetical protein